jgi:hypothetical protein
VKCPHCTVAFSANYHSELIERPGEFTKWWTRTARCPECKEFIVEVAHSDKKEMLPLAKWFMIHPRGANRGPVPISVPAPIAEDYIEACNVLPISPKASAALSRRCLQNILRSHGYQAKQLWQEIDLILAETDTTKAIPTNLRLSIDGIRHFGNFSAHPTENITTLEIIDVEAGEAEWCLQILEDMFEHFYVRPADALARKTALDAKLVAAGKQPSK